LALEAAMLASSKKVQEHTLEARSDWDLTVGDNLNADETRPYLSGQF
jgi:hypothetical protein